MATAEDWQDELRRWLGPFLSHLGHKARRRMCPLYVAGLMRARSHAGAQSQGLLGALALLVLSSQLSAAPLRIPCDRAQCQEFDIVDKRAVRTGPDGTLVWTRMRIWTGTGLFFRAGEREETGYVFCSTRRPAIISTEKEATAAVMLAPLSDWEYDKALNNYLIYFEVCHNAGAQVTSERTALARRLGYSVLRLNSTRPLGLTRPESIFYFPPASRRDRP